MPVLFKRAFLFDISLNDVYAFCKLHPMMEIDIKGDIYGNNDPIKYQIVFLVKFMLLTLISI